MKRLFWILVFLSFDLILDAQDKIPIKETQLGINTIDGTTVQVNLYFNLISGYRQRTSMFSTNNPEIVYSINSITQKDIVSDSKSYNEITCGNDFVGFRIEAGSMLMNKILEGNADYFIEINDTIKIEIINDSLKKAVTYILTPDQVKEHTRNKMILSEEQRDEIIKSAGGEINLAENNIDFGFIPKDESNSGSTEYYINFNYRQGYRFLKNSPVFFQASGLLSTNFNDSLNYIRIFPVSYSLMKKRNEFTCQAGIEANQVFSSYRISGDIHWQGIIPNLIDMTYGANRLRLKPVIQAGVKVYQEVENNRSAETHKNVFSAIVFTEAYYYIPVLKLYSLILEGNAFYDFNTITNTDKNIKYLYSVTVGMEIPNSGIKTIFRYTNGETDINYAGSSTIMIGLMADLFSNIVK